ncbi:putative protein kinase [Trypanosoma conorhini]|uniref:Protein kinase domain-containing protein n=1 Tax=Trypanosoma conorhini TaxID=83891 RepID=A0A3S5IT95_9TRYP|nr:putative protein kinase [Trypanosoma conorhini]RNF17150.1 putative protein kinase [Trypanosoma conorhini]
MARRGGEEGSSCGASPVSVRESPMHLYPKGKPRVELGLEEGGFEPNRRSCTVNFRLGSWNSNSRAVAGNEGGHPFSDLSLSSLKVSPPPRHATATHERIAEEATVESAFCWEQATVAPADSHQANRDIYSSPQPKDVLESFSQGIAARDAVEQSSSTLLTDDQGLPHGEYAFLRSSTHRGHSVPVSLDRFGKTPYFSRARSVHAAGTISASRFSPTAPGHVEVEGASGICTMGPSPATSSLAHALFPRLTPGENPVGSPNMGDGVDATVPKFTLGHYILSRSKPAVRGRPLSRPLYPVFIVLVLLPFLLIALLFGLHYWANTELISKLHTQIRSSSRAGSQCDNAFFGEQSRRISSMSRDGFILMLGILLAFVILVVGGAFFIWVLLWRSVFSTYFQTLAFIRGAALRLSKIEALGPEELARAPRPILPFLFCCRATGRKRKRTVSEGIVEEAVKLGRILTDLKRYVPSTGRGDIVTAALCGLNPEGSTTVNILELQSDRASGGPSVREESPVSAGNLNPLRLDAQTSSAASVRRDTLGFGGEPRRRYGSETPWEDKHVTGDAESNANLSASCHRCICSTRSASLNLNVSMSTNLAFLPGSSRHSLFWCSNRERSSSEAAGARMAELNDQSPSVRQVTFMVCRLFLPRLEFDSDDSVKIDCVRQVEGMSRRFLRTVLRVTKEERGLPFDIRLDSVILLFYTPSGPNSVNLIQPRNCALRLVSELSRPELDRGATSSTQMQWGIAMHTGSLMVGVSNTTSRRFSFVYGEELQLAYRVAELCRILNCPLIMLQACYELFRVCITAVPVDVIYNETFRGKGPIYLYEPKAPEEEEDLDAKREYYEPFTEAFGLLCGRQFADAARKLEGIVDLDHNVKRLHRLCSYFHQLQNEGKLDAILSPNTTYLREGPHWGLLQEKVQKFLKESCLQEEQQRVCRCGSTPDNREENVENAVNSCQAFRCVGNGREMGDSESVGSCGTHSGSTSLHPGAAAEDEIALLPNDPVPPLSPLFGVTTPPFNAFHDGDDQSSYTAQPASKLEHGEGHEIGVRYSSGAEVLPGMYSAAELDSEFAPHHCSGADDIASYTWGHNDDSNKAKKGKHVFYVYEPLGRGSFGVVYRGLHPNGYIVAVKAYPVTEQDANNVRTQIARSEIKMLSSCRHKNIVRYITSFYQAEHFYTITEFVSGGSLTALVNTFQRLPHNAIRRYTGDILRGLQYLHGRRLVHRDISPNNVLVDIDGVCKLSDFGGVVEYALHPTDRGAEHTPKIAAGVCAQTGVILTSEEVASVTGTVILKNCFGTPVCMSPEACSGVVDPKNDIWALGITLCFCFSGRFPWPEEEMCDVATFIDKVRSGVLIPQVPYHTMDSQAADFIGLCLRRDVASRPSAHKLLFHLFVVS